MADTGIDDEADSRTHCGIDGSFVLADPGVVVPVSRYDQQPVHTGKRRIQSLRLVKITMTDLYSACAEVVRFFRVSDADYHVSCRYRLQ
ncbi:hypothetical protein D3C73_1287550 [compost metagenome]